MYDLFLSYSYNRADGKAVAEIQKILEDSGLKTFFDARSLTPGLPWATALENALGSAKAVAAFIGREIGVWQKREISYALDRQAEEERSQLSFPVIPVLLPDSDPGVVAGFLKLNTWIDLRSGPYSSEQLDGLRQAALGTKTEGAAANRAIISPYRGLREFREQDAYVFKGREKFADRLFKAVDTRPLVALVGNSGSGKSSVAQAGLIPLLRRRRPPNETWDVLVMRPGKTPFYCLAEAVASLLYPGLEKLDLLEKISALEEKLAAGKVPFWAVVKSVLEDSNGTDRLLLIVDQFEELFTLNEADRRSPFIHCVLEALDKTVLRLLLNFRADFYGRAIGESRELSDLIEQGVVNLGPMTSDELKCAIEQPGLLVGLGFESGLVSRIVSDAGDEPGNLPLVEFALTELADSARRQGNLLTHAAYDAIGQIAGRLPGAPMRSSTSCPLSSRPPRRAFLPVWFAWLCQAKGRIRGNWPILRDWPLRLAL